MIRILTALALIASPALAQDLPMGCFARSYSAAHLAKNPGQNVAALTARFRPGTAASGGAPTMEVQARLADQGRARAEGLGGAVLAQTAYCFIDETGGWACVVECDGGTMEIGRLKGDTLDLSTRYFLIGDVEGCGGLFDLAEGAGATIYRLTKAGATTCLEGL
jgi:hypothetical protein